MKTVRGGVLFLPQGVEFDLIFAIRTAVSEMRANFQHCHIWPWNLAICQSSRRCRYILSFYWGGSKLSLFSLHGQRFPRYRPIFKLSLLLLYGQRFPRYGPIFKIAIFGHGTWSLTKDPGVAHILFSTAWGRNWAYFSLPAAVYEIWAHFQNGHIWANLAIGQSSRSCTYTP